MANLSTKPLRQHRSPAYPTKLEVMKDSSLLAKHVPPAWVTRNEIAGLLALSLAGNTIGCSDDTGSAAARATVGCTATTHVFLPEVAAKDRLVVSGLPVPPKCLAEEDAAEIIAAELATYDLRFSDEDVVLHNVIIEGRDVEFKYEWLTATTDVGIGVVRSPLELDWIVAGHCVGLEYVSDEEYFQLGGPYTGFGSEGTKAAAAYVGQRLVEEGPGIYVGVLYAPSLQDWTPESLDIHRESHFSPEELQEALRKQAEDNLRQQISQFIEWLKGQGVI